MENEVKAKAGDKTPAKASKPKKKETPYLIRMYHQFNSVIDVPEVDVEEHLKAGWRLEK